jgi:hypothetical protein
MWSKQPSAGLFYALCRLPTAPKRSDIATVHNVFLAIPVNGADAPLAARLLDSAAELRQGRGDGVWELHNKDFTVLQYVDAEDVVGDIDAWATTAMDMATVLAPSGGISTRPLLVSGLVKVRCRPFPRRGPSMAS